MDFWNSLWNIIWVIVSAFVFVAYLIALFSIISDLFRDRELNGWWKALWLVLLIFVPFITSLVYLIARGQGMAERTHKAAVGNANAVEDYIPQRRDRQGQGPVRCRHHQRRRIRNPAGPGTEPSRKGRSDGLTANAAAQQAQTGKRQPKGLAFSYCGWVISPA